ncbi:adenylate isopentenyltransferase 5, chloroplastic-like protein [Tanacetum coccineum]
MNLKEAIDKIKANTCKLATRQLQNIMRLENQLEWNMHHLDATEAFLKQGFEAHEAWERLVARPSSLIVRDFLYDETEESAPNFPNIIRTTQKPTGHSSSPVDDHNVNSRVAEP